MPNYTTRRGRRTVRRRRRVKPTATVKGYQINALARRMKRMMPKMEWKMVDKDFDPAIVTSAGVITNLIEVTQGDTETTRDGDRIFLKNMFIRFSVTPNLVAGNNYLRVLIVQDRQTNLAVPAVADVLQTVPYYLSPMNRVNLKRFKPLFDRTYAVDSDANGPQVDKLFRKIRIVVDYSSVGLIPNTNGVWLLAVSDAAVNGPTFGWYSRIRFTDG